MVSDGQGEALSNEPSMTSIESWSTAAVISLAILSAEATNSYDCQGQVQFLLGLIVLVLYHRAPVPFGAIGQGADPWQRRLDARGLFSTYHAEAATQSDNSRRARAFGF